MERRIRLALVGLNFGRHIAEHELLDGHGAPHVELAGICDLDHGKAAALAARYGVRHYGTLDEILRDPAIEAVALYIPPHGRARVIEQCLSAGKHVMTTKPFEDNVPAARRALEMARSRGLVIHLNSPAPTPCGEFLRFREWEQEFSLGRPVSAFWETHARYSEVADGTWMDDPELCPAAPVFRLGIYGIADLIELCGPAIECRVLQSRTETGRPTMDNGMLSVRFENGCLGCIAASFRVDNGTPYRNTLLIHYEHGSVTRSIPCLNVPDRKIQIGLQTIQNGIPVVRQEFIDEAGRAGQYQWSEFNRAIREKLSIQSEYINRIVGTVELINQFRDQAVHELFQLSV